MNVNQLDKNEYDPYYHRYISQLSAGTPLIKGYEDGKHAVCRFFESIPEEKWDNRYLPGKWTIKEVLQHLIDTERIFMYRCFRIARLDDTPLAGFDQQIYNEPSGATEKSMHALLHEFTTTRIASISLLIGLNEQCLKHIGQANQSAMSARAAAFIVIGHEIWHMDIIKERYLKDLKMNVN
ncbi:MAG: DinB family protein [Reichenbachiella sp.]|uniref:DinB family protein n=1 Tax=Reichenbachiella sp. TaxID=2184521 RepID=UPI003267566C